jgi:hypothetical protein
MQDKIWQFICDDMGWEFIKSIWKGTFSFNSNILFWK